ncbi:MAG: hypothetical protein RLZZ546_2700 [Bacteroidota bacterium]|jgi:endo-1,4-beta-xylanase
MKHHLFFLSLCLVNLLSSCKDKDKNSTYRYNSIIDSHLGLKNIFKNDFKIGVAINSNQIAEADILAAKLIPREFNTLTPENIMKCEIIHPSWDSFEFKMADKIIDLSKKHNMFLVGHTLVWHSQLAPFVQNIKSKDSLLLFLKNHITTIGKRYDRKVDAWDVVNEALEEDGSMRKSLFYEKLGENYVVEAFKLAKQASPNAELYYNDYNIEQPKKRAGAIALIKKIQASGARIDGVGIQGHWSINGLPLDEIEKSIIEYHALGLKVMITELDITTLPNPWDLKGADVNQNYEGSPYMNPYPNGLPDSVSLKLAASYEALFKIFLKHKDKIDRVTFWGVNDGNSWLNNWPIKNRTNYPLLFDRNYQPKEAYRKVVAVKKA